MNPNQHYQPGAPGNPLCLFCSGYEDKIEPEKNFPPLEDIVAMEKHDIIMEISSAIGDEPEMISVAERIFQRIRYRVTEFVLKREYNRYDGISVPLAIWLEKKQNPESLEKLNNIIDNYLEKH